MLILVPAAGASSRMRGRDKLMEQVDHQPLLARQLSVALDTGARVLVTLPQNASERLGVVNGILDDRLAVAELPDAAEGMAASIRSGAEHAQAQGADALMILLADLPEIEPDDLRRMMRAFEGSNVLRACDESGTPGHPVLFPARLFSALLTVTGDTGARAVLAQERVVLLPLSGSRATTDLDTPEDWDAWRKRTGR